MMGIEEFIDKYCAQEFNLRPYQKKLLEAIATNKPFGAVTRGGRDYISHLSLAFRVINGYIKLGDDILVISPDKREYRRVRDLLQEWGFTRTFEILDKIAPNPE